MLHILLATARQSDQCNKKLKCRSRLSQASITPRESGVWILPKKQSGDIVGRAQKREIPSQDG